MTGGIITTGTRIVVTNGQNETILDSKIVVRGDLNSDGIITTSDLVYLRRYLVNLSKLENELLAAADINKDGKVTTSDLVLVRRNLVNLYDIVQ
ncbi:MAG: dockerin type I repeat-containing protein [Clostridia bacterium]|nr:dockerin type I repeat-containing protein [Clostridia bacterium]